MFARTLRLWFGFDDTVPRLPYLVSGLVLALFKFAVEALVVERIFGKGFGVAEFMLPLGRFEVLTTTAWRVGYLAWCLPFIWIGVSMSVRRALDAGMRPGTGLLFLLPMVNYLLMALLSALPSAALPASIHEVRLRMRGIALALAGAAVVVVVMTSLSALAFHDYGLALFASTPAVIGFGVGWYFNREGPISRLTTMGLAFLAIVVGAGGLVMVSLEGMMCVVAAVPLAAALAVPASLLGRHVALLGHHRLTPLLVLLLSLPALMGAAPTQPVVRMVSSVVEVAAPPSAVWPHVIGFSEIAAEPGWLFRHGVAYPIRARIEGEGPGAIRRCEFSTGAFIEPITEWTPPHHLAFDVQQTPPALKEWSPYRVVHAPHTNGYLSSQRGEFLLSDLPNGRTRLEGRTYYRMALAPDWYWGKFGDAIIHAIHNRVLRHVAALAESH